MQFECVKIHRQSAWSAIEVEVSFGNHTAERTCRNEKEALRFIGSEMKKAMERFVNARGHAYSRTGRLSQERFNTVQLLRYRLSSPGVWDAKKSAQVFLRSAGEMLRLMPHRESRLYRGCEKLINDLSTYSSYLISH